jgi:dihydroflavonol-4-reductase
MSRVLVTGASGFVGSAVLRALLAQGEEVRALVRPTSPKTNLRGLGCEVVLGDLGDPASLRRAMDGCDDLFHVAADYRLWARNPEDIIANNREGTRNVLEAAKQVGVRRIVYTSSVATLKPRRDGGDANERDRAAVDTAIGAYKKSKVVAERVVEEYAQQGLPIVLVSPSTPIGPRDVRPTPTGRIIVEAARGRIPAFVDTGLNLVHVDDVAAGHLLARTHGRIGETYILGGQNATLKQMLAEIARLTGRKAPAVRLPRLPLYPLALVAEIAAGLSGKEPFVTRDGLAMSRHHMFFSSAKAAAELGYHARPYAEALRDALGWFEAEGYLS